MKTAAVKKPLERPYTGPHKVLERISDLNFKIEVNGKPRVVTTELLKPTHFVPEDLQTPDLENAPPCSRPIGPSSVQPLKTNSRKCVTFNLTKDS